MTSDIDFVIKASQRIETMIETVLSATGQGLHEKTNSVESELGELLAEDIRFVATVRNKVVHEGGVLSEDERDQISEVIIDVAYQLAMRKVTSEPFHQDLEQKKFDKPERKASDEFLDKGYVWPLHNLIHEDGVGRYLIGGLAIAIFFTLSSLNVNFFLAAFLAATPSLGIYQGWKVDPRPFLLAIYTFIFTLIMLCLYYSYQAISSE